MIIILFNDYTETHMVYHVVTISDLKKTLENGIKYDDKHTYKSKYYNFHNYLDKNRPVYIPEWVQRSKAIFASLNFKENHCWHSHSALLGIKIKEDRCWICNENIANFLYEPLILQDVPGFESAKEFIMKHGNKIAEDYWNSSLSFKDNLKVRKDKMAGYDAEVLILHDIPPEDIKLLYIASDHKYMEVNKWKEFFSSSDFNYSNC